MPGKSFKKIILSQMVVQNGDLYTMVESVNNHQLNTSKDETWGKIFHETPPNALKHHIFGGSAWVIYVCCFCLLLASHIYIIININNQRNRCLLKIGLNISILPQKSGAKVSKKKGETHHLLYPKNLQQDPLNGPLHLSI